ncbi:MAG: ATP-binding cassette domain-containing protein, partial [Gemmatimonadales bacterium]
SGGQRQRVGVARALAADPPLLLLDEPFGALDPITRVELQGEFRSLEGRLGKAMVFVTHDVREGLRLGTRIGVMQSGRLVFLGTPEELRRAEHPEVRAFLEAA